MRALWALAAMALVACDDTAPATTSQPATTTIDVSTRLSQLEGFVPDPALAGEQCGDMSVSNGTVQLEAYPVGVANRFQQQTIVDGADLKVSVHFGSGFPSFTCTDLQDEAQLATVEETWPATASSGTWTVAPSPTCSVGTLALVDVVAHAPDGQEVPMGDFVLTNPAWQWWHPSECHIDVSSQVLPTIDTTAVATHEVGALTPVPVEPELLATLPVGAGPGQLGIEDCSECDPGRPWSPVVDSVGRIIIADSTNHRWVIVDDGATTEVPYAPGTFVLGVAMGPQDVVYTIELSDGDYALRAYDSTEMATAILYQPIGEALFGTISFSGYLVTVRGSVTQHFALTRGVSTSPRVTPEFLSSPPQLAATFEDGRHEIWQLPTDLSPVLPVAIGNGSVVVRGGTVPGELICVELAENGRVGATSLRTTNDAFNDSVSIDERGIVTLELDDAHQAWRVLRFPLPLA